MDIKEHILKHKLAGVIWCPERKFLFMKASRTAGTSMYRNVMKLTIKNIYDGKHDIVKNWLDTITNEELINDYFIFTFTRNPFDRVVSLFYHRGFRVKKENNKIIFNEFVKNRLENQIEIDEHFYPFSKFIETDDKLQYVDFIGRFENLNNNWKTVAEKINVSIKLPKYRIRTPKADQLFHTYYTEESLKIVSKLYNRDFELLGYEQMLDIKKEE